MGKDGLNTTDDVPVKPAEPVQPPAAPPASPEE